MTNSLLNVLGIVTAFMTAIALLSLIVTALVQMTQAAFGVRGKNLHFVLRHLLDVVKTDANENPRENAGEVLNAAPSSLLTRQYDFTKRFSRIIGPAVSWLEPEELAYALRESSVELDDAQQEKIKNGFDAMKRPVQKRLNRNMRFLTVAWAIGVAFVFQVSTPHLISKLSADPEARARYLVAVDDSLDQVEQALVRLESYEDVSARALADIERQFPEVEELIEEASGLGREKSYLVDELNVVLAGNDSRRAVVGAYESRLDDLVGESRDVAVDEAKKAMSSLALLGIEPWGDPQFYSGGGSIRWANLLGVLVTALLLSFGAPFWFDNLKRVAGLRDALKPVEADSGERGGSS